MIVAGLSVILVLLAFLLVEETSRVYRSSVVGPTRRRVLIGGVLAGLTAALVLPRLVELLT